MRGILLPLLSGLMTLVLYSCGSNSQSGKNTATKLVPAAQTKINGTRLEQPEKRQQYVSGQILEFRLTKITDTVPEIDSVEVRLGKEPGLVLKSEPYLSELESGGLSMGTQALRVICHYSDGRKEYHNSEIVVISDIVPTLLDYEVLNIWPHDIGSYTQGLVFEDGFLYEGTGQWTESSLRKNVIRTGEPERLLSLSDDVFGEGIAIFENRIYQLTYKSQVGFVYEKESFRRIQKVYYENKEGWGLTQDGENLIMSDGSHRIYYMDPEYFTEIQQIEVYDNNSPVSRLNELEFIEGKIFANVYGEEEIVIIDPGSGKVTARLNMRGLLREEDRHRRIDVFNGIAWDPERKVLYVTGKYWPSMFEIRIKGEF